MAEALHQANDESASDGEQRAGEVLSNDALEWLATLPETVRPNEMPVRFPRIANALARRWFNGAACRAYLDDLLIDKRGTRSGLPSEVAEELATLKDYCETVLYPVPQTVWDEVAERRRKP